MNSFILYEKRLNIALFSRILALTFALIITSTFALAQGPSLKSWFDPVPTEDEQETTLYVEYGTVDEPVDELTSVTFTIDYEGFDIVSEPYLELEQSWFCEDGGCISSSVSVDNESNQLTIELVRADDDPKGGYGTIAVVKGIISVMDDLHGKKEMTKGVTGVKVFPRISEPIAFSYQFDRQLLLIHNLDVREAMRRTGYLELTIMETSGKVILHTVHVEPAMRVELNPRTVYLIHLVVGREVYQGKIVLEP
jgi:hypothetical protein